MKQPSFCEIRPRQETTPPHPAEQASDIIPYAQGRVYRDQELVWYILERPWEILEHSHEGNNRTVCLWPGILRTSFHPSPHVAGPQQCTEGQQIFYFITAPSLGRTYRVPQTSIVPFQAHSPDEDFLVRARSAGLEISFSNPDHAFDPLPKSSALVAPRTTHSDVGASPLDVLIMDIAMVKQVARIWTITDKISPYPDPNDTISGSTTFVEPPPLAGGTRMRASTSTEEVRYRGLWWGAERIFAGDLLILSFLEDAVTCTTTSLSYFVQDVQDEGRTDGLSASKQKPEKRCLFLKLKSLNKVGTAVYVVGELYKLVSLVGQTPTLQQGDDLEGVPPPPHGFAFRSMLYPDFEAKLPIKLVRGRYYLRSHLSVDGQSTIKEHDLRTIEGCSQPDPGVDRPTKYKWESRVSLLKSICRVGEYIA